MADEITLDAQLRYVRGGREFLNRRIVAASIDQTTEGLEGGIFEIGTTEETVALAEIGTPGWAWLQNLDTTNYVEIGPAAGSYLVKLAAGEGHPIHLSTATLYCKADTGAVKLEVRVLED